MTNIQILRIILPILIISLIIFLLTFISSIDSRRKSRFRRKMMEQIRAIDKLEEFESIYTQMINNLDIDKLKSDKIMRIFGYFICIFGVIFTILEILCNRKQVLISMILLTCLFTVIMLINKNAFKYDGEVIEQFIKAINPNIKYINKIDESGLDIDKINLNTHSREEVLTYIKNIFNVDIVKIKLYSSAGFRDEDSNRAYITDYIEYETNLGSGVEMADVHLLQCQRYAIDVYEGIIAKISREKNIENEILIERNKIIKKGNRVKSELDEFEKYFDIYANKDYNIDSILSTDVKKKILSLYKEYGIMFEISIKGKNIFVRFFTGSIFEKVCIGTWGSKKKMYREYVIFKSVLEIIDRIEEIL